MKKVFGKDLKGNDVCAFTLENENVSFTVIEYGARLVKFIDKKTNTDVVLGFDQIDEYLTEDGTYIGASIGRIANRIGRGQFALNGKNYQIPCNNNGNANHGGIEGFDRKVFKGEEEEKTICFTRVSPDGEEGFPGNLIVQVKYHLLEDGIEIETTAESDEDTIFAYTNHAFFNLSNETILNSEIQIHANQYAKNDINGMSVEGLSNVENTPFDFRQMTKIGDVFDLSNEQLKWAKGFDHHYRILGEGMREMAVLKYGNQVLTMSSDYPGMHIYTANYLDNLVGKENRAYHPQYAVCLEAEYQPNGINYPTVKEKPIVKKGEKQVHHIRFQLKHLV